MRDHEGCNCLFGLLLVHRRGNNERMEGLKIRIRCKRCTYRAHGGMWDIGIGGLIALVGSSISNRGSGEVRVLPLNVR